MWDADKAELRGKFRAISAYVRTELIKDLNFHPKNQEKGRKLKPTLSIRKQNKINSRNKLNIIDKEIKKLKVEYLKKLIKHINP